MANLIIKSSADDLILKGSGGNSAITVGASGNTTLAGTANNLGTSTAGTFTSGVTFPAGHVINTYCVAKLDVQTFADELLRADITGLLIEDITPKNSSSKFLVRFDVTYWGHDIAMNIERKIASGSYAIIQPPTGLSGSRWPSHSGGGHRGIYDMNSASMTLLDAPATASDVHYKITLNNCPATGPDGYINRASTMETGANDEQGVSTITVQEIAG